MANKPISASMLQEIIRLKLANKSHCKISSILQISRPIVIKYVNKIESLNLSYSKLLDKSESDLNTFRINLILFIKELKNRCTSIYEKFSA